jgi:hypothetical protein
MLGAMEPRSHCLRRDLQKLRHFLGRQCLYLTQNEHYMESLRQFGYCSFDERPQFSTRCKLFGIFAGDEGRMKQDLSCGLTGLDGHRRTDAAPMHQRLVDDDPREPGADVTFTPKARPVPEKTQIALLHGIFGGCLVLQDASGYSKQPTIVRGHYEAGILNLLD